MIWFHPIYFNGERSRQPVWICHKKWCFMRICYRIKDCNPAIVSSEMLFNCPTVCRSNKRPGQEARSKAYWVFDKWLMEEFICSLLVEFPEWNILSKWRFKELILNSWYFSNAKRKPEWPAELTLFKSSFCKNCNKFSFVIVVVEVLKWILTVLCEVQKRYLWV